MKKYKNNILFVIILMCVFLLGFLTKGILNKNSYSVKYIDETEVLLNHYSDLPYAIDSLEKLSISYIDTANLEMLHYVLEYTDIDDSILPYFYITKFGDTIEYNKENFHYHVAMNKVSENLLITRKHIINGLLLNNKVVEQDKIREKIEQ